MTYICLWADLQTHLPTNSLPSGSAQTRMLEAPKPSLPTSKTPTAYHKKTIISPTADCQNTTVCKAPTTLTLLTIANPTQFDRCMERLLCTQAKQTIIHVASKFLHMLAQTGNLHQKQTWPVVQKIASWSRRVVLSAISADIYFLRVSLLK